MTSVTLRAANSKLMKLWVECEVKRIEDFDSRRSSKYLYVCLCIVFVHSQVKVMKYHVEAKDNAKFLGSIEKASHCIYLQVFIQQPDDKS